MIIKEEQEGNLWVKSEEELCTIEESNMGYEQQVCISNKEKINTKVQGRRLGMYSCGIRVYISEEEMQKAEKEDQAYIQTEEGFRRTKMMQQVEIGL